MDQNEHQLDMQQRGGVFPGFAAPTSNTTFVPNQFFDVVLPHSSRGVVRLVGYLIRRILGWCDEHGNPQQERIAITYSEIERRAGIGHSSLRQALNEAAAGRFIRCVRDAEASDQNQAAVSAVYELAWDPGEQYIKDPKQFRGFFEPAGNRTDIPNQFLDHVVRSEPLSVIQVVGAIARFSIGFQARRGVRRQIASLSYQELQRYTRIRSRAALAAAIARAEAANYIVRVDHGVFDKNAGRGSRPGSYALRWSDGFTTPTPKSVPADHSENWTEVTPKSEPANHSEKRTDIQTKQRNETKKQKPVSLVNPQGQQMLIEAGFDATAAKVLADRYGLERIRRQVQWLPGRGSARNRLGLLRAAIVGDWPAPGKVGPAQLSRQTALAESVKSLAGRLSVHQTHS